MLFGSEEAVVTFLNRFFQKNYQLAIPYAFVHFKSSFLASCDCGSSVKKYWAPTTEPIPRDAYYSNQLAFSTHSFSCPDLCICDINDRCYTRTSPWVYVELVPHCSGKANFLATIGWLIFWRSPLGKHVKNSVFRR